ncbi:O-methyltransferase [Sorangium sp. So ce145]|uniref:O-methyltransferase n=1 Tax=Sorangium sp. So ce145 TaxID=3133285 RepID=UPI003F64115D
MHAALSPPRRPRPPPRKRRPAHGGPADEIQQRHRKAGPDGIEKLVRSWEFYSTTDAPHRLDLPALSSLERLTMESSHNARRKLGFDLPSSDMGEDPFYVYKKFYGLYSYFSRVEL